MNNKKDLTLFTFPAMCIKNMTSIEGKPICQKDHGYVCSTKDGFFVNVYGEKQSFTLNADVNSAPEDSFFTYFEPVSIIHNASFAQKLLSPNVQNDIYRTEWKKHVIYDVQSRAEDVGVKLTEDIIDMIAERYTCEGDYDCNLSYWDNIDNLIHDYTPCEMPFAKDKGVTYLQPVQDKRQLSLWYGGDVVNIKTPNGNEFIISAEGKVSMRVMRDDETILNVYDEDNNGAFGNEIAAYLHTDIELDQLLLEKHPVYRLHKDLKNEYNNWTIRVIIDREKSLKDVFFEFRVDLSWVIDYVFRHEDDLAEVLGERKSPCSTSKHPPKTLYPSC